MIVTGNSIPCHSNFNPGGAKLGHARRHGLRHPKVTVVKKSYYWNRRHASASIQACACTISLMSTKASFKTWFSCLRTMNGLLAKFLKLFGLCLGHVRWAHRFCATWWLSPKWLGGPFGDHSSNYDSSDRHFRDHIQHIKMTLKVQPPCITRQMRNPHIYHDFQSWFKSKCDAVQSIFRPLFFWHFGTTNWCLQIKFRSWQVPQVPRCRAILDTVPDVLNFSKTNLNTIRGLNVIGTPKLRFGGSHQIWAPTNFSANLNTSY